MSYFPFFYFSGVDLNGGGKEEDTEWTVIIYNLAVAKFQQRHILQVVMNAFNVNFLCVLYFLLSFGTNLREL